MILLTIIGQINKVIYNDNKELHISSCSNSCNYEKAICNGHWVIFKVNGKSSASAIVPEMIRQIPFI